MSLHSGVGVNFALKLQKVRLSAQDAAEILHSKFPSITKAKIFDRDGAVLDALRENGIKHVIIAVPNFEVNDLADDKVNDPADSRKKSRKIVEDDIVPQIKKGLSLSVAISNEPFADWNRNRINPEKLKQAYCNLRTSLLANKLSRSVKITIPFHFGILGKSYPPSEGEFQTQFIEPLKSLAALLYEDGSTFDINIYPFFAHRDNEKHVSLPYALGDREVYVGGVMYKGLLHAQVTAVRAALLRLDSRFTDSGLPIVVGETGWPTAGHKSATVDNAARYLKNAVASRIPMYLFEAFDEQKKSKDQGAGAVGDKTEDNFGLFYESGELKTDILSDGTACCLS